MWPRVTEGNPGTEAYPSKEVPEGAGRAFARLAIYFHR